ncbi:hypothetical protein IAU60_003684 [Kwoniella sp. DSM 27419]
MRARLPPLVISTIESRLRSDVQPVLDLSPLVGRAGRGSGAGLLPLIRLEDGEPARPARTKPLVTAGSLSQSRPPRPISDPIPLSAPYLLRTGPKKQAHIVTAHSALDSDEFDPTSPSSVLRRQVTYSRLISTFLHHPHAAVAVQSLLSRSADEGVPISVPTLTSILKVTLSNPDVAERRQVVQIILPLLPDKLDVPLLDVLLRSVIRDTSANPETVEAMIADCLKLEDDNQVGRSGWSLEVWDLLLVSYAQAGDFRGALNTLTELRHVVESRLTSMPSSSTSPPKLGPRDHKAVCKAYTTVLQAFRQQKRDKVSGRAGSATLVPRRLAKDLVELLNGERPTVGFLNAWMRAERAAGQVKAARQIWELIDVQQSAPTDSDASSGAVEAGASDMQAERRPAEEGPNGESWNQYFGLYLTSDSGTLPPLRRSMKRLFTQLHARHSASTAPDTVADQESPAPLLDTRLSNAIIKAIFHAPASPAEKDLPAVLVVLRQMRWADVQPDRKTIDVLASGVMGVIYHLSPAQLRALGISLKTVLRIEADMEVSSGTATNAARRKVASASAKGWQRLGLGIRAWDILTDIVHQIRLNRDPDQSVDLVYLPLCMPVARLSPMSPATYSSRDPATPRGPDEVPTSSRSAGTETTVHSFGSSIETSPDSFDAKPPLPSMVLPALIELTERLIVQLARQARAASRRVADDRRTIDDHALLRDVLRAAEDDLTPIRR